MSMEITVRWLAANQHIGYTCKTRKCAEAKYKELKKEGYAYLSKITKVISTDVEEIK